MLFAKNFKFYFGMLYLIKILFHSLCIYPAGKKRCVWHIDFSQESSQVSDEFIQIHNLQTNAVKNDCVLDWFY